MLDAALAQKALFAPGKGWSTATPTTSLAGLIVQKVTGRPISEEITKRIINRIGLRHTYWPAHRATRASASPTPRATSAEPPGGPLVDVTDRGPVHGRGRPDSSSPPRATSTASSSRCSDGKLLKPEQLTQMQTTVDGQRLRCHRRAATGSGLARMKLSCGGFAWTHGGDAPGYVTRNAVTGDGRAATVAVTGPAMTLARRPAPRGRPRHRTVQVSTTPSKRQPPPGAREGRGRFPPSSALAAFPDVPPVLRLMPSRPAARPRPSRARASGQGLAWGEPHPRDDLRSCMQREGLYPAGIVEPPGRS